jgi:hypothetical protein
MVFVILAVQLVMLGVERSRKPETGFYQVHYRYGEKEGDLMAEYFERDGKLAFKITPKEK